ncbi:MAG: NAD(P)-dependent oxidoreductase [Pseudomonadota bacterium]|nr:NAD(P)-dependent oxidoreductase [Pseudomonadota bacterium]MED5368609.1 NAD(P)-dependent oxidoreductase [Pseudomonadota bacterium]
MLPIILDVSSLKVAVIGNGLQAVKRLDMLRDADVSEIDIFSPDPGNEMKAAAGNMMKLRLPSVEDISSYAIIFIANLEAEEVEKLAGQAREQGVLVNVEDVKPLCDFHVPSIIRRGKLLLTASTGGMSPALARRLREFLAARFAPVWADRLEIIGAARHKWRDEGLSFGEVTKNTNDLIDEEGWLECPCPLKTEKS